MADSRPERRFTRIDRLPPYVLNITAELKMAARRRGEDIIDFSMGNPDGATPPHIVEKLCTVAQRPDTHGYSTSRGIPRLRRAISRWYQERYDVEIDPESEAIVTIGSKEGLAHLMLATLDHGDTVLVPNPSYPIHIYGAVIAGAQVRSVPLVEGVDFFNELERAIRESYPKPKMMIFQVFLPTRLRSASSWSSSKKLWPWLNAMTCWWFMTWPMPISSTMAGKRRRLWRYRALVMSRWSFSPYRKATTWRAGVSVLW